MISNPPESASSSDISGRAPSENTAPLPRSPDKMCACHHQQLKQLQTSIALHRQLLDQLQNNAFFAVATRVGNIPGSNEGGADAAAA